MGSGEGALHVLKASSALTWGQQPPKVLSKGMTCPRCPREAIGAAESKADSGGRFWGRGTQEGFLMVGARKREDVKPRAQNEGERTVTTEPGQQGRD